MILADLKRSPSDPAAVQYPSHTKDTFRFPTGVSVAVVDRHGQTAYLNYVLAVEIADSLIGEAVANVHLKQKKAEEELEKAKVERLAKRKKEMEKEAQRREEAAQARTVQIEREQAEKMRANASIEARLDTLEKRLGKIEESLGQILEAIQGKAEESPEAGKKE
jgi:uncharacterized protein YqfA (UPF0365 family)